MPSIDIGSQLVGFRVKLGRSRLQGDASDVQRDALEDLRDRVGDGADLGGLGVDVEGVPDHDGAEVEGTGDRGGDDRQAQRGAFVGAGEVGLALDVEGGRCPLRRRR